MPTKWWKHECKGLTSWQSIEICTTCGERGAFDGWGYRMHEAMARYQKKYGFKPIGPHRLLVDELFAGTTRRCEKCAGKGLLDVNDGEACVTCSTCDGLGSLFVVSPTEIAGIRAQVLEKFPDSGTAVPIGEIARAVLIQDVAEGVILDVTDPSSGARS